MTKQNCKLGRLGTIEKEFCRHQSHLSSVAENGFAGARLDDHEQVGRLLIGKLRSKRARGQALNFGVMYFRP